MEEDILNAFSDLELNGYCGCYLAIDSKSDEISIVGITPSKTSDYLINKMKRCNFVVKKHELSGWDYFYYRVG